MDGRDAPPPKRRSVDRISAAIAEKGPWRTENLDIHPTTSTLAAIAASRTSPDLTGSSQARSIN